MDGIGVLVSLTQTRCNRGFGLCDSTHKPRSFHDERARPNRHIFL